MEFELLCFSFHSSQILADWSSYHEKEVLKRLAADDEAAFNEIYLLYNKVIFNAAMIYVKDFHRAQDVVQQAFVKIWEKRARLSGVDCLQDYIVVLARNLIYDEFRKKSVEARKLSGFRDLQEEMPPDSGADEADKQEYRLMLHTAIRKLPAQQQKVFLLIQYEELTYDEAARNMNLSKFTVKKHLELARRFLRDYISRNLSVIVLIYILIVC